MMVEKIKNFRDLKIWTKGVEIVECIYTTTRVFPKEEIYGLVSQMRRCAVSIPANIAEGFTRRHSKEYQQFLYIALGSAAELESHIEIAFRLGFIKGQLRIDLLEHINHLNRMTMNLMKLL